MVALSAEHWALLMADLKACWMAGDWAAPTDDSQVGWMVVLKGDHLVDWTADSRVCLLVARSAGDLADSTVDWTAVHWVLAWVDITAVP